MLMPFEAVPRTLPALVLMTGCDSLDKVPAERLAFGNDEAKMRCASMAPPPSTEHLSRARRSMARSVLRKRVIGSSFKKEASEKE